MPYTPRFHEWTTLGLSAGCHTNWSQAPDKMRATVRAERSICQSDGWIVLYVDGKSHITLGSHFQSQTARDIAAFLAGRAGTIVNGRLELAHGHS